MNRYITAALVVVLALVAIVVTQQGIRLDALEAAQTEHERRLTVTDQAIQELHRSATEPAADPLETWR